MTTILGITDSHCSTAALLVDGQIIACASEERFTRRKNQGGYPQQSIDYCLSFLPEGSASLDAVALAGHEAMDPEWFNRLTQDETYIDDYFEIPRDFQRLHRIPFSLNRRQKKSWKQKRAITQMERFREITQHTGISESHIRSIDHHLCHAAAAYFAAPFAGEEAIVLTNDNAGDGLCASVNLASRNGIHQISASRSAHGSLGSFYSLVTVFLGMRQLEHEYKVMGMAPYAPDFGRKTVREIFQEMMEYIPAGLDEGAKFLWKVRKRRFAHMMMKLARMRFDWVAGAAQDFLENMLQKWAEEGLHLAGKEKIKNRVALSGGIFMNVKANLLLANLSGISDLFIMPSCGDESNAIGAAYQAYHESKGKTKSESRYSPIDHIYLGPEFTSHEMETTLQTRGASERYKVSRPTNLEDHAAALLAEDGIIARMSGRMEFGARALGNRSILGDPRDYRIVAKINRMIKNRDFWMPFAPTVLAGRAKDYLINPKDLDSSFMMLAFDTTSEGQGCLPAAIHPYDSTARPQILRETDNPAYHRLIQCFEARTGIGAVLNTSFNLHGDPIVCSPTDALETFEKSGLPHLILGEFLVSKRNFGTS
jgi:carbamoyltransferase